MRMSQQDLPNKSGHVIIRSELRIETGFPQISCIKDVKFIIIFIILFRNIYMYIYIYIYTYFVVLFCRTHDRTRSPRFAASVPQNKACKGCRQTRSVTWGKGQALRIGST